MPAITPPDPKELSAMMGAAASAAWQEILAFLDEQYEMETLWNTSGRAGPYEYKFRRGGKTLCALYPREGGFGFLVVLGRAEQEKFEAMQGDFSAEAVRVYAETKVYHDGRWLMLDVRDGQLLPDARRLLLLKRRPNRKGAG